VFALALVIMKRLRVKKPTRTLAFSRSIAHSLVLWAGLAVVFAAFGYAKSGATGVRKELLDFFFMNLVLLPVIPALLCARKLEQHLKPRFPVGASFMAIAAALVVSVPTGLYLAVHVLLYIEVLANS
jgi:hypothetical protein